MDERERARRMQIRRAKRRRNVLIMKCIISLLTLIVVFLAVILIKDAVIPGLKNHKNSKKPEAQQTVQQKDDGTHYTYKSYKRIFAYCMKQLAKKKKR